MATQMRRVFHSSLMKTGWIVSEGGEIVSRNSNQGANEAAAIAAGQKANQDGSLGQVVLHKNDGTIREERIYGREPERMPG